MKKITAIALILMTVFSCGSKKNHYYEDPIQMMVLSMQNDQLFSIVLKDMDIRDGEGYHKYGVARTTAAGDVLASETGWKMVEPSFFEKNKPNLGMVIANKDSTGKISFNAIPPGFNNYVGNPKYGQWQNQNGNQVWSFFSSYLMLRGVLGLMGGPIYYGHHRDYYNYRSYGGGGSYYGNAGNGSTRYGSSSSYMKKTNPGFFQRKSRNSNWNKKFTSSSRRSGRGGGFGFGK